MAASMSVPEFYAGKSIFITGATGFMGKVMVEKLLRCCPEIEKIYLLMRPKKGQTVEERLDDFVNCRVFDKLHINSQASLKKLHMIPGDVLQEDLGISIMDWDLLQKECQIIFHCAACVRFDMFIRDAVNLNTLGTLKVLKLAEGMKNLEAFVHVSTAYCHCELEVLDEKLYPSKHRPQDILELMKWMDDETLTHLQQKLIYPQPNTYAYSKSLTEDLVSQYAEKFPIVIARPSIVVAALKEPVPGWVDNLNSITGLIVGASKGVIRTMHCSDFHQAEVIPVDMAVNACILLAPLRATDKSKELKICNVTQSGVNSITWGKTLDIGRFYLKDYPFSVCLWYPRGSMKSNKLHHQIDAFFSHWLLAYFIDILVIFMGKKPFMVKVQKRVTYGLNVLEYYTSREWHFKNDYYQSLKTLISAQDNEVFYTDMSTLNWDDFVKNYLKGAREYCCKEDPSTLPQARRLHKQLFYLDIFMKTLLFISFVYFFYFYIVKSFV